MWFSNFLLDLILFIKRGLHVLTQQFHIVSLNSYFHTLFTRCVIDFETDYEEELSRLV